MSAANAFYRKTASTGISQRDAWQVSRRHLESWRCWDGEIVIYDDLSGDTMKLDIIMSAIFRFMLQRPATQTAITEHLAVALDLTADKQLRHITAMALHRLCEAEVVQPLSTPGAPGLG